MKVQATDQLVDSVNCGWSQKRVIMDLYTNKVMLSVWWYCRGVIPWDHSPLLEKMKEIFGMQVTSLVHNALGAC